MNAGKLKRVLTYQTPTVTPGALRQDRITWSDVGTYRAEVRTPNGRETLLAQQYQVQCNKVITTRFPGFRFEPRGRLVETAAGATRIYNITFSDDPDGRRRKLVTYAVEQVGATS